MINLGKINRLRINRVGAYDIYLDGGDSGEVLLLDSTKGDGDAAGYTEGDELEVFVFIDVDDTLVATTTIPSVMAGGCAACLLYTSPSPRDATLSRMPSSA